MNTRLLPLLATLVISGSAFAQKAPDLKKLDAYIADAMVKFDQPGLAVGIVKDGTLVYGKGFGKLDLAKADPVTPNSIFFIASMSKAFTACAIGLLVDDGKLRMERPRSQTHALVQHAGSVCHGTHDGEGPPMSPQRLDHLRWRPVVVWHRSGPTRDPGAPRARTDGPSVPRRIRVQQPDVHRGRAVDRSSERENVGRFRDRAHTPPLGMSRTTVDTKALASMPDIALPHVRSGQVANAPQVSMPYQTLEGADGACGINSCINDLAKWDAMWANEGKVDGKAFISDATYGEITAIHLAMGGRRDGAALGWFVEENNGNTVITHSGGMPGFILRSCSGTGKGLGGDLFGQRRELQRVRHNEQDPGSLPR
ncbi:MAG: serine hydrolase [Flavobacteriales bacterium]|nr:serine hydrolase [Flavobacteriales bacterium]